MDDVSNNRNTPIGLSFCGRYGEANRTEGTILSVTCKSCSRAAGKDPMRFPGQLEPFTLKGGKAVHIGRIKVLWRVLRDLDKLERTAAVFMLDEGRLAEIKAVIALERAEWAAGT